jgi:hypothetical protein
VLRAYLLVSSFTVIIKIVLVGETHSHGPICIEQSGINSYVKNTSQRLSKLNYEIRPEKVQLSL